MRRHQKYSLENLPEPGAVFTMPLEDGRTGICRVLRRILFNRVPVVLVVASDWIGGEPPELSDPAVRRILSLTHHGWSGKPEMLWISEPPPKEFRELGRIRVLRRDAKADCGSFGNWDSLPLQVLMQWRWDNERERVLAEDAVKKDLKDVKLADAARKRSEYLATVSFADLLAKELFPIWDEYPPRAAKEGCDRIVRSFIRSLDSATKPLLPDYVLAKLKECVESLNRLDFEQKGFIETVEREDLCEVLETILYAAKLPELSERIHDWRDW